MKYRISLFEENNAISTYQNWIVRDELWHSDIAAKSK